MSTLAGRRDLRRYSRHLLIPEVGLAGQERLAAARVLVIGAGGLGSPVLAYLAAAGIGRIILIDDDTVDVTNLQRQILYDTADVGAPKAHRAAERLRALNPQIAIDALATRFDAANARELVRLADVVVDGSDTFSTRYLVNDACVLEGKPDVHGSIFRFDGQVSVFGAPGGPCYRCLYPESPPEHLVPSCSEGGVLGVLAGMVGTFQANEAIKLVLGIGAPLIGRLLLIDALDARVREVRIARDPECPLCGDAPSIAEVGSVPDRTPAAEHGPRPRSRRARRGARRRCGAARRARSARARAGRGARRRRHSGDRARSADARAGQREDVRRRLPRRQQVALGRRAPQGSGLREGLSPA